MPNVIEQQICDAIDMLINKRVANLQFDKTVRATIKSIEDPSIGKYLVQYQDSSFFAYSDPDKSYKVGAQVYVEIPSSDFNKTKIIIGSVKKLGTEYLTAVSAEQRMTKIGNNILKNKQSIEFCSYDKSPSTKDGVELLTNYIEINEDDFKAYKIDKEYFSIGMTVRTSLPIEQQVGGGNYGIVMQVEYYTTAQRQSLGDDRSTVIRTYVLDVNNMLGQPYKYILPEYQYAIFAIDGKNLKGITSIKAFCKGFPIQKDGQPADIFLSNFQVNFMQPLSESQLSTSSLKILTPYGAYFIDENDDTKYLEAELKLKGKKVSFEDQKVDFYWFVKDTNVTAADQLYYSPLAGQGWRCLNRAQTYDGLTQFTPQGYRKHITLDMAPAKQTTFKCVAAYEGTTLSATIKIKNNVSQTEINITSSAGTKFYFDTGETTLTCNVKTKQLGTLLYHWGHRTSDGIFHADDDYTTASFTTPINVADDLVTYECTVYLKKPSGEQSLLGSAQLTLTNGVPQNEYVLVINNGTKVFKYDEYGVSPASKSVAPADRITIPTLSFDIYDDQGRIVTPLNDSDKVRQCEIKWIWPDEDYTMLQHSTFTLTEDKIINPTTNGYISRQVLANSATLTFEIKNKFDIDAIDNDIRLEVGFQGHNLVASTNFTFVKQGQLGTNGTQYVSRLVPYNDLYEKVYLENGNIWTWYQTISKTYNPTSGKYDVSDKYTFTRSNTTAPLRAQLWNGQDTSLYNSKRSASNISAKLSWELIDVGRSTTHNATINSNGIITPGTAYSNVSTVVKSTINTSELSQLAKNYYATYPLDVVKTPSASLHAIVVGGFNQCMYNSDGTRGSFDTRPFTLKVFNGNTEQTVTASKITWTVSWYTAAKNNALKGKNSVTIEPPAMYNSQTTNNYIIVSYSDNNGSYKLIISVHLYLNRYGLSAMNDWDGTSIKINNEGNQYILAPQIGAGQKNNDNTFTGITMGKSFGVNGNANDPQIGLMGFNKGIRSIFLDAETGRAMFGSAESGQITISPQKYGKAPTGAIYSWNFYNHDTTGKPTSENGAGLLIDLQTPAIRFGSGNFSVDQNGHLVAKGGGTIANWKITDNYLRSQDDKTTLYAQNGPVLKDTSIRERFNIGNGKFIIYDDGSFKAANNKFGVTQDGRITALEGQIAGWQISKTAGQNNGQIKGGNTILYQNGTIECSDLIANNTGYIGGWVIDKTKLRNSNSSVNINSDGTLQGPYWLIRNDGYAEFSNVKITGDNTSQFTWGTGKFQVHTDGSMQAYAGKIGGFSLANSALTNGNFSIHPTQGLNLNGAFKVNTSGYLQSTSGKIGGWGIGSSQLKAGGTTLSSDGTITCAKLIATQSGQIGSWTIDSNGLTSGSNYIRPGGISCGGLQAPGASIRASDGDYSLSSVKQVADENNTDIFYIKQDVYGNHEGTCTVSGTVGGESVTLSGRCVITIS